jgi:hypothetical protein
MSYTSTEAPRSTARARAARARPRRRRELRLGAAPLLALVAAGGVLAVALGNNASREAEASAQPLFWGGLVLIYAPIAFRLLSTSASRAERLALVLTLGMAMFAVKLLYSPVKPTPYDELAVWRQTFDFVENGHLFSFNPLVEGYAGYPGLETITGTISNLAGLSIFQSGQLVIGVARGILMLALFLLLERVTGSARAAGIGAALYACNPSFLYFDAQIGHESLALVIAAALLLLAVRWNEPEPAEATSRAAPSLVIAMALLGGALTMIHHMTAYAVTIFLAVWAVLAWQAGGSSGQWTGGAEPQIKALSRWVPAWLRGGVGFPALLMLALSVGWFVFVAGGHTVNELGAVLKGAIEGPINVLTGGSGPKNLFEGGGRTNSTAARALALASIIPVLALIPLGFLRVWREGARRPIWRALALVGALYPVTLGLRLTLAGTETSQRASEFVFVGLAFLGGLLVSELPMPRRWAQRALGGAAMVAVGTIVFLGGVIISSLPANRQPGSFLVSAEARSVSAPNLALARFAAENLPPGSRVLADRPNATLLGSFGGLNPVFGQIDGIPITRVLFGTEFGPIDRRVIVDDAIEYIVVDRRQTRELPLVGYYVESFEPGAFTRRRPLDPEAFRKFDSVPGLSRIYENGPIVLYDTSGLLR